MDMVASSNKFNEFNHAEDPARQLLERLGWTYVPRESLDGGAGAVSGRCCSK